MTIDIDGRLVGDGHPCLVVAEAGVNHNGSIELALRLVDAAADAGADAVKFQTFVADQLVTASASKAPYQIQNTGRAGSQLEMLRALELDGAAFVRLQARSAERGIRILSTPFDEGSADMLAARGVPALKLSSGDLTDTPLLAHVARLGKPVILSTGMAWLSEVEVAVRALQAAGATQIAVLHCVSCYPAAPADANLRALATLRAAFGLPTGFSDHTEGVAVSLAAVALGANIVEKHLTLDRNLPGPDHLASLDPLGFREFVSMVRQVEESLGDGRKRPVPAEHQVAEAARRSLVTACAIPEGTTVTASMIVARRPGSGIPPTQLERLIGRQSRCQIPAGALLTWDMFR